MAHTEQLGRVPPEGCVDNKFLEIIHSSQAVHEFSDTERRGLHFGRNMVPILEPQADRGTRRSGRTESERTRGGGGR